MNNAVLRTGADRSDTLARDDATVLPIGIDEIEAFVREVLLDPLRRAPVVAVTTHPRARQPWLSPARLQAELGERAQVCLLETGDVTWRLSWLLPDRLDVFGGAVRVWWPGLCATSDPLDHPLVLVFGPDTLERAHQRVLEIIGAGVARDERAASPAPAGARPAAFAAAGIDKVVETATVTSISGSDIEVSVRGERGLLAYADVKLSVLARRLAVGQRISVFASPTRRHGLPGWSVQGLEPASAPMVAASPRAMPSPRPPARAAATDPWQRIAEEYEEGNVVRARIIHMDERFLLVELLPGAKAIVHVSELDYSRVSDPAELFHVGQVVQVLLLELDARARRCQGSIKRAYGNEVHPPIALEPGGAPFLADEERAPAGARDLGQSLRLVEQRLEEVEEERRQLADDRKQLIERTRELGEQNAGLRKELRSLEDRMTVREREAQAIDPLASATSFLTAVRVEYALRFGESDRLAYPLQRMAVGREFLARVRELGGIEVEKIVEVCAQVASGRCHEIPARLVHELRFGEGGTPTRFRASDGARAWRCALQINTPSARRLHWWSIPGAEGATIEFASVAVHDDFSIPD